MPLRVIALAATLRATLQAILQATLCHLIPAIYIAYLPLFHPLLLSLALDPRIKAYFYEIKGKPLPPSEVYLSEQREQAPDRV